MRNLFLATTALFGAAIATPALAQDTNPTFTGPRVEATIGFDSIGAGSDVDVDGNDQSVEGFLYGVGIGYDFAAGGALVGVEAELTDSTGSVESSNNDPETFGFGRVGTGRDIYVGGRVGILANPQTLVYVKGGYTNARLDALGRVGNDELETDIELEGYRLGAGAERAIGRNSFVKVEYRYSNYNDATVLFDGDAVSGTFDIDSDRHQVAASVGFRF